jgi:CPA2 family monovalent cation:H+ antiporter-2
LAWLTELVGLSLALGAFIAGMLISETEYKHQVETDIRPFHDVLLGLFFISIGMLLDWRLVLERWPLVLLLVTLPVLFKAALVTAAVQSAGRTSGVSLRTGLYLAQAGEFGFVLLTLAQKPMRWCRRRCSIPFWPAWCCRCWPRPSSSCTATAS